MPMTNSMKNVGAEEQAKAINWTGPYRGSGGGGYNGNLATDTREENGTKLAGKKTPIRATRGGKMAIKVES